MSGKDAEGEAVRSQEGEARLSRGRWPVARGAGGRRAGPSAAACVRDPGPAYGTGSPESSKRSYWKLRDHAHLKGRENSRPHGVFLGDAGPRGAKGVAVLRGPARGSRRVRCGVGPARSEGRPRGRFLFAKGRGACPKDEV